MGFVGSSVICFILADGYLPLKILIVALVASRGARLSACIFRRNHARGEGPRCPTWRKAGSEKFWWASFFNVYLRRGVLMWITSIPLLAAQYGNESNQSTVQDVVGASI